MASLKGNVILNGINTVSGILFPMITFPYAARVLMPEGIGEINFLNSIIGYIVLLTSLGIPMYAVKEIAKYRNDKILRDRITIELLIISTALCVIGYIGVWLLAKFVPEIREQSSLFYLLSLAILFNSIGVNWFYQGIEDFKFITIRGLVIRILSMLSLFIFVKDSSDLMAYGAILVCSNVGNYLLNFIHLKKHVSLSSLSIKEIQIIRHIKPTLQVFLLNIISSLYLQLNTVMLGFISSEEEVGYFTAGTKITHIAISLITSATTVLIPRGANLIKEGNIEGFSHIIRNTIKLTTLFSYPMMVGLMVLAGPITLVFCGSDYYNSISVLLLNSPLILIISFTAIMAHQTLYPMERVNLVIWSVSGGALANIVLNFLLIPFFGANGAAVSTLITEIIVFMILVILGKKYYPFNTASFFQFKYLAGSIIMGIIVSAILYLPVDSWVKLIIGVPLGALTYIMFLLIIKDPIINNLKRLRKPSFLVR